MKLDQLRYFLKVVECHSFHQAARELYMTQPALTKSIQALEDELSVTLLHRSKTGTYPTEYGLRVYNDSKSIIDALEDKIASWHTFQAEREKITGTVHLAAIPVLCNLILEKIIDEITTTYPEIDIMLHDVPMNTFPDELLRGRFNVGITSVTLDQQDEQERRFRSMHFHATQLLADDYAIYLSTKNPCAARLALTPEDCRHLRLITYSSNQPVEFTGVFALFRQKQFFNSIGNILQMVADDKGVTVLMREAMKKNWYVQNGFICEKSLKNTHIMPNEHMLLRADAPLLTAAERAVADYIQENYARLYHEKF